MHCGLIADSVHRVLQVRQRADTVMARLASRAREWKVALQVEVRRRRQRLLNSSAGHVASAGLTYQPRLRSHVPDSATPSPLPTHAMHVRSVHC